MAEIFITDEEWKHVKIECDCVQIRKMSLLMGREVPHCFICRDTGKVPIRSVFPMVWRCACGAFNIGTGSLIRECGRCGKLRGRGQEMSLAEWMSKGVVKRASY